MIARALQRMLAPLLLAFESPSYLAALLEDLGWTVDELLLDLPAVQGVLPVVEDIQQLAVLVEGYDEGTAELGEVVEQSVLLAQGVFEAIAALSSLSQGGISAFVAPLDDPDTWVEIALDLPEYLFVTWLRTDAPLVLALCELAGAIVPVERGPDRTPRYELDWGALTALLEDPPEALANTYGWGTEFEHGLLVGRLAKLGRACGLPAVRRSPSEHLTTTWLGGSAAEDLRALTLPLHSGFSADGLAYFKAGLLVLPVPSSGSGDPDAMLLTTELMGQVTGEIGLPSDLYLNLSAGADVSGALGVLFHPGGVDLAASAEASIDVSLELRGAPETPWVLIGNPEGTPDGTSCSDGRLDTEGERCCAFECVAGGC